MDLDTWVSIAALAAVLLSFYGLLSRSIGQLSRRLDGMDQSLGATRTSLEDKVGHVEATLRSDIVRLDEKVDATRVALEERIGSVEVGLRGEISGLDQKIDAT
ncbi:hypothetical protein AB3X52_12525, partial [Nocardioides sp. DS6]